MAARNQAGKNQTKDLKCATHLLSEKFINMSEKKKTIVRDLGFGGLMHIPALRVHHQLLRELANNFKLGENILETGYGSFKIKLKTIGDALGINASGDLFPQKVNYKKLSEDDKEIFRRFQGKTLKNLTDEMMDIGVDDFLLPTTINKISPVHLAPIFEMDTITERNWGGHVLSFIIKGITDYKEKKKKAIDGCLFAPMIIYFHLSKNKDKKRAERPPKPWIANWSKEQLIERMSAEIEENMASSTSSSETETTDSDSSTSESETQEDSEDSPRKQPSKKGKKYEIGSEDLDELLRENNENSAAQGEKEADLPSTEGHYVSSETLSLVEESASEPADSNMMVVRKETPSEGLAIVPIQVCLPVSQTTTVPEFEETPETEYEPTPLLQIEGPRITTPETPQQLKESTPTLPPAPSKTNPAPKDAAALMMMARTALYVPKKDLMPSFSLGFTDSSQEETTTQEGPSTQDEQRAKTPETPKLLEQLEDLVHKIASGGVTKKEKSPPIPKESGAESFEEFETPVRPNLNTTDMKQKCYHWAIRVKTYSNGRTNEFDDIVTVMCFIINQQNIPRFQEEVYCLPPDIVNMALSNHPDGVFLQPKNNKPFRVEDYPMFIPFLDLQKLKSHRYIFALVCHSQHRWLWFTDTRKRKFYIVDPYHTKSPSDERTALNTFVGYVISRIKVYAGGTTEIKGQGQGNCSTIPSHLGPKDKWLEIFEPANHKRRKYEWDNWTQDEVDHFRVEYAFRILFHDMNLDKDEAIRGSNAIRLSKPSSLLLSPYCQINSQDVDTA
uniref:Ubiquitin-like protease family profile domain-containing protein n=1 Tax=Arachis hypogaea TaxID=3818 RepID=G0Y6V8_ARAHY|nr:hypothetical protein 205D04_8 [Arachis hypogaea]